MEQEMIETLIEENRKIDEHNQRFEEGEELYKMRINKFALLSFQEKKTYLGGFTVSRKSSQGFDGKAKASDEIQPLPQPSFPPAPDSLDYRKLGYVAPVRDQGEKILRSPSIG
jgi:cathepsin L